MTEKIEDKAKTRLEQLAVEVLDLDKWRHTNFYHVMLEIWLVIILVGIGFYTIAAAWLPTFLQVSHESQVAPVIFGATITVNGIMIGFASVTGFNIARMITLTGGVGGLIRRLALV